MTLIVKRRRNRYRHRDRILPRRSRPVPPQGPPRYIKSLVAEAHVLALDSDTDSDPDSERFSPEDLSVRSVPLWFLKAGG